MGNKFKGKYRNESFRLKGWDYRNNGSYFITICTHKMDHFFGHIAGEEMFLNEMGEFAHKFWAEIPEHFAHVRLGEFVVMPNHVHGVIIIIDDDIVSSTVVGSPHCDDPTTVHCDDPTTVQCDDPTAIDTGNPENDLKNRITRKKGTNKKMSDITPKSGSVSTIINSYKSAVTKKARKIDLNFKWQSKFHDRIIRDRREFKNVQNYIQNNPKNWKDDDIFL